MITSTAITISSLVMIVMSIIHSLVLYLPDQYTIIKGDNHTWIIVLCGIHSINVYLYRFLVLFTSTQIIRVTEM